ncbi:hypothetical protein [Paenibacillus sp. MMS20-IR301]|uniref:hypothetical protein n=1 Tax=Paenibacillus sp. MMS20-IR301 TaxID=2895946 RepID=UPI0028E4C8F4|nr:hypothetical protein [Paenibacillus sp. MMS20-IR301]WNS45816.1 hypothetical protein LOS79_11265 [Paenibacillus sp. MMS20-IR301]
MSLLMSLGFLVLAGAPLVWYYAALGKRITAEEKKAGRDLSSEINPFTGGR